MKIVVTGAAGQIAYQLLFRIASGDLFGNTPISLHLLDLPAMDKSLIGVKMELEDCAFPFLQEIKTGSDPYTLFKDVNIALLVGAMPRGPGMERKDLLLKNAQIFKEQGKALDQVASRDVKVFVVGNPCNTNCWITMKNAPSLPKKNFMAMTRLDENRAKSLLAREAGVPLTEVKKVIIWGNHSSTQVPDYLHATISGRPACDVIQNTKWLQEDFIKIVQERGAAVIAARGKSSAASAANAVIDSIRSLYQKTPSDDLFSLAVCSDKNPYGIAEDLFFSFPCRSKGEGDYEVLSDFHVDAFLEKKIKLTEKELIEERAQIYG